MIFWDDKWLGDTTLINKYSILYVNSLIRRLKLVRWVLEMEIHESER